MPSSLVLLPYSLIQAHQEQELSYNNFQKSSPESPNSLLKLLLLQSTHPYPLYSASYQITHTKPFPNYSSSQQHFPSQVLFQVPDF
eukprot:maker-scaffold_1-snap-gene-8.2-mRNA-1 protein AED:0.27 eAED:0.27 QI:0/0.5/0.33/1/0/0/3/1061/85